MLELWIIKELEKREQEKKEREQEEERRLPFYTPDYYPESNPNRKNDGEKPDRRVIIIDPGEDDKKSDSIEIDFSELFVCDEYNTHQLAVTFDSGQTLKIPRSLLRLGFLGSNLKYYNPNIYKP